MVRTLVIFVAALTVGCGWRYAGEMETRRTARPDQPVRRPSTKKAPSQPAPAVLQAAASSAQVILGARDLFTLGENHRASLSAPPNQMHHHAFEVRLGDALNDARQLMHCSSGKVVRFEKRPAGPGELARLEAAGIPPGVWILEVDPTGQRPDLPNNDWYRHISKHHRLEFLGRNPTHDTVIYRYRGPRRSLSLR